MTSTLHLPELTDEYLLLGFEVDNVTALECATKPFLPFMKKRSEPRCGRVAFMIQTDRQLPGEFEGFNTVRVSTIQGVPTPETAAKLKDGLEKFKLKHPSFHYGIIRENGTLGYYIHFIG